MITFHFLAIDRLKLIFIFENIKVIDFFNGQHSVGRLAYSLVVVFSKKNGLLHFGVLWTFS